jgi:hypothetical protein
MHKLPKPVQIDCVGSQQSAEFIATIHHPEIGKVKSIYLGNSPSIVSMGQLVRNGYAFVWSPKAYSQPTLVKPDGDSIKLGLSNGCPVLALSSRAWLQSNPLPNDHRIIHFPMEENCLICDTAKMKKKPARRKIVGEQNVAQVCNERFSVDLLESSDVDYCNNMYVFTGRDDHSNYLYASPQQTKHAEVCLESLLGYIRNHGKPKAIRSDVGSEFQGVFERFLRENLIGREYGIPYRSTSDSRHERRHQDINRAVRAILLQAGLPDSFWADAVLYSVFCMNHLVSKDGIETPCQILSKSKFAQPENSGDDESSNTSSEAFRQGACECIPKIIKKFGCFPAFGETVLFYDEKTSKHESRARVGICLGGFEDLQAMRVLDLAQFVKHGMVSIHRTRDIKVVRDNFATRKYNLRSDSDFELYEVIKEVETKAAPFCHRCWKPVFRNEIRCTKCKNKKAKAKHSFDDFCSLRKCMCQDPIIIQRECEIVPENADEMEDSEMIDITTEVEEPPGSEATSELNIKKLVDILRKRSKQMTEVNNTNPTQNIDLDPNISPASIISPRLGVISDNEASGSMEFQSISDDSESPLPNIMNDYDGHQPQVGESHPEMDSTTNFQELSNGSSDDDESVESCEQEERRYPLRPNRGVLPSRYASLALIHSQNPIACLTKQVDLNEMTRIGAARRAVENELAKVINYQVIRWEDVVEKAKTEKVPGAQFVKTHMILGVKNFEQAPEKRKWKARFVAQGCVIKDSKGKKVGAEPFPFESPASLQAVRIVLWNACQKGNDAFFADIEAAYLHATFKGPPTFVTLLPQLLPSNLRNYTYPVFPLRKALYGMPRSGSDFGDYLRKIVTSLEWKQSQFDMNLYYKGNLLMALYVDDVIMSGNAILARKEMENLKAKVSIQTYSKISESNKTNPIHFLGADFYKDHDHICMDGTKYARFILYRYQEICRSLGLAISSKGVATPVSSASVDHEENMKPGRFKDFAAEMNGMLLWLQRSTRPDISHSVSIISREVGRWTKHMDRVLDRTIRYLRDNEFILRFKIRTRADDKRELKMLCYTDSDFNSDEIRRRSTGCWAVFLESEGKHLVDWGAKTQNITASSTADAELNALHMAMRKSFIPMLGMIQEVASDVKMMVMCDNQATIRAIQNGYSTALRSTAKLNQINISILHHVLSNKLYHVASRDNVADVGTKALSPDVFRKHAKTLGLVMNQGVHEPVLDPGELFSKKESH